MTVTRRDFVRASTALGAALGVSRTLLVSSKEARAAAVGAPEVVWLQGQNCTGCSVSFLNSIYYATADKLLLDTLDVKYHETVMAGAGSTAVSAAQAAYDKGGYVLVVEGAIPTARSGRYCYVWQGTTMLSAVKSYAAKASMILAVGTCASFGGIAAGRPNPTLARSVKRIVGSKKTVVNISGCPVHPDWLVGTVAYILASGAVPALDTYGRPKQYYGTKVHRQCPYSDDDDCEHKVSSFGQRGGLGDLGCKGRWTYADCPTRRWNSPAASTPGVNWCVNAGSPCHGCTASNFPDGMSPFFVGTYGDD
jgi:NiFe hydrogenase small subunit HydA